MKDFINSERVLWIVLILIILLVTFCSGSGNSNEFKEKAKELCNVNNTEVAYVSQEKSIVVCK